MYSKVLAVAAVCVVCVLAAPPTDVVPLEKQQPTVIPIVSQSEELEANGTFKFSYETGNGIKREEEAYEKVVPKVEGRSASSDEGGESDEDSNEIHVQRGSYSYTAPDGTVITVSYIADENGFQPVGDHIPRVSSSVPAASPEKSAKLVKSADSAASASEPKKVEKPIPVPAIVPVPASAPLSAAKPEEPLKEITTEKSDEAPEKPAPEESSSETTPNSTPTQPTSAESSEAAASTYASDEKQTTANPITEASQSSEAENPSTTSSAASSGEELSTTAAS